MGSESKSRVYAAMSSLNKIKWRTALKGILAGIVAGLLVVAYRYIIEFGVETSKEIYSAIKINPIMLLPWLAVIGIVGFIVAKLMKYEPMAGGSGIPQVEGMVVHGMKIKSYSVLIVRFLAGSLTSFFGLSLGREGPSIQIGAAGSQAISEKICSNKIEENYLITAGAAAGLSAAFNAPLSAIVFALEEVHRSFSALLLITATAAALTTDVVSKIFFGLKPVLSFAQTPELPTNLYLWLIPLGIISGLVGSITNKSLLKFQDYYQKIPSFLRPIIAMLFALPIGIFLPQLLGGGANLVNSAEIARTGIPLLLVLLLAKLLFTCTSFGSGVPGGIFLPILSVGALSGSIFALIAINFGLPAKYIADFAVCAMAGALSSSVKAPVTSILLTAEMTGSLVHLFPVAACVFIALFVSDLLKVSPIYEALYDKMVDEKGEEHKNRKPGSILEIPVEIGSEVAGKTICEIKLPSGILIVGIHRGESDIVPNGSTLIKPGDYLVVLSSKHSYENINDHMRKMCHNKI